MAEASRGRVTITLGRSGQVVKKIGSELGAGYSDSILGAGSKRSVRDRLGSILDSSSLHGRETNNKRARADSGLSGTGQDDFGISKDDLRFKLNQKNIRRAQSNNHQKGMDLREKLSRMGQAPATVFDTQKQFPMPKDAGILGRIPPMRSADDFPKTNMSRPSYSGWNLDHLRQRSPDRILGTSVGLPLPRNVGELQRRPLSNTFDDVRVVPYIRKDVLDAPRPVTAAPFVTRPALPTISAKPVLPPPPPRPPFLSQLPPAASLMQKSSYAEDKQGDEQQTVDGLLHSLRLGKYAILFKAEEVDMTALKQMGENDLKELGIPMGPRKKILLALLPPSKRQR